MRAVVTIGVHGWTLDTFLGALRDAGVAILLDVRRRRGMRGREYAWANAARLQASLAGAEIAYRHHLELAPTAELRRLQDAVDARLGVGPRSRDNLSPAYGERYEREVLDAIDLTSIVAGAPGEGAAALLCVEREPEACHRSLIAARLAAHGAAVAHLRP